MQEKTVQEHELDTQDCIDTQTDESKSDNAAQIQELTEENEMLFEQLHIVQEELERYYYKLKEAEKRPTSASSHLADLQLQIENIRLTALVNAYKSVRKAETNNTMHARIGFTIMQLKKSLLTAPFRLLPTLLFFTKNTSPEAFGGKEFTKVIAAYEKDGIEAVKALVKNVSTTSFVKANAYITVAKHLQEKDLRTCTELARLAYMTDPQGYRLKWWIFRLIDMKEFVQAEALSALLPDDGTISSKDQDKIKKALDNTCQQINNSILKNTTQKNNTGSQRRELLEVRNKLSIANNVLLQNKMQLQKYDKKISDKTKKIKKLKNKIVKIRNMYAEIKTMYNFYKKHSDMIKEHNTYRNDILINKKNNASS